MAPIKIVKPGEIVEFVPAQASASAPPSPARAPAKQLCRNLLLYGSCRYQNTTCPHSHDSLDQAAPHATTSSAGLSATSAPFSFSPSPSATPAPSLAAAAHAAVFVPGAGPATPGAGMAAGAIEFVPKRAATGMDTPARESTPALSEDLPFFSPPGQAVHQQHDPGQGQPPSAMSDAHLAEYFSQQLDMGFQNPEYALHQHHQQHPQDAAMYQLGHPGNGEYYASHPQQHQQPAFNRQPLQYHLYHPPPSSTNQPISSFFLPPSLHTTLTSKSEATHQVPSVDLKLPDDVGGYTALLPLDKNEPGAVGGYRTRTYKAFKVGSGLGGSTGGEGKAYVLKRVEGFRLAHEAAIGLVDKWTRVRHPSLVAVREAFTTRAFGDHSIIFVYDFHPISTTLYETHLSPITLPINPWSPPTIHQSHPYRRGGPPLAPSQSGVQERVLWSYIVQLASAIKTIHSQGLAVRGLEVNRVIVTGKNRVRISGCSMPDVIAWDGGGNAGAFQQDDLLSFGKLLIILACGSTTAVHNLPKSVDYISRIYSPDLKNLVLYLLSKPGPRKSIEEVVSLIAGRIGEELNASLVAEDVLEDQLMRELENGRLVRLLAKFGFINERPEFDHDPRWAETGDRYIIKLFRDYVFHQVDENGRPVTDLSHVLVSLNKLDAGVEEKIMLVSRDEQSCLIVSYREIKACIDSAFLDLSRG